MYIPLYLLSKAPISIDNGHLSSQTGLLQTLEKETALVARNAESFIETGQRLTEDADNDIRACTAFS